MESVPFGIRQLGARTSRWLVDTFHDGVQGRFQDFDNGDPTFTKIYFLETFRYDID